MIKTLLERHLKWKLMQIWSLGCSQGCSGKIFFCSLDPCNKSFSLPAQPGSSPASLRAQFGVSEVPPQHLQPENKRVCNQRLGIGRGKGRGKKEEKKGREKNRRKKREGKKKGRKKREGKERKGKWKGEKKGQKKRKKMKGRK